MEDQHCRHYFLTPQQTTHRRYEALRAVFLNGEPLAAVAERFGYKVSALKSMACRFRAEYRRDATPPFSFPMAADAIPDHAAARTDTGRTCPKSRIAES